MTLQYLTPNDIRTICALSAKLHESLNGDFGTQLEQFIQSLSLPARAELGGLYLASRHGENFELAVKRAAGGATGIHLVLRKQSRLAMFLQNGCDMLGIKMEEPAAEDVDEDVEEEAAVE